MKLLLFTSVVCFAAVLAAPADKQKRDILPGDPRYGTDYHHDHHHHEHDNEVQISKAAGGYVGSYAVNDENQSGEAQPQPHSAYGPPNHKVGQLLGSDFVTSDNAKATAFVPSTSYGIPDTQVFNDFLGSIDDTKSNAVVKTAVHEHPKYEIVQKSELHQPAVLHKHVETVSVPQVKVTTSHLPLQTQGVVQHNVPSVTSSVKTYPSYSYTSYNNIPLKTIDHNVHVQVPHPYPVPITKHVAYSVPVPHRVDVPKPYYVRVPQPVQVPVNRPYAVEVPRAVPYPVPHYVQTSVPVIQPHGVFLDGTRASSYPFQGFFENAQLQNVLANFPSFQNPLEGFQNPFENFELPSFPSLPPFPGLPSFTPSQQPAPSQPANSAASASNADAVAVDNLALKVEKPNQFKPATACAGCSVGAVKGGSALNGAFANGSASSATSGVAVTTKQQDQVQEHVQSTDANGGYIY